MMKRTLVTLICLILVAFSLQIRVNAQDIGGPAQQKAQFATDKEKLGYILGYFYGTNLNSDQVEMDTTSFCNGLKDAFSGRASLLPDTTMDKMYSNFREELQVKRMMRAKERGEKNKKEADSCLAENKKKDSVITLPSGLQYKILREGTGISPTLDDTVITNYRAWFLNGKEFDNSYSRGEPATFRLKGVIKGWTEALQLMKVGSKWQLWIPSSLGYGEQGYRNVIEPNALLLFEIELLDVKKGQPPAVKTEEKTAPKKEAAKKDVKKETKKK
ncbi:MAG: FKBP-type peptidyl-prolyl cis-trans isomerase [Bacteroidota bacterium]